MKLGCQCKGKDHKVQVRHEEALVGALYLIVKLNEGSLPALVVAQHLGRVEPDLMKPTQSWMESAVQVLEADILSIGCTIFWSTQSQSPVSAILSSL